MPRRARPAVGFRYCALSTKMRRLGRAIYGAQRTRPGRPGRHDRPRTEAHNVDGLLSWLVVAGVAWLVAMPITFGPVLRRAQAARRR
jgi:hypothetical protein